MSMHITCGAGERAGLISFNLSQIINLRALGGEGGGRILRNTIFHHRYHYCVFFPVYPVFVVVPGEMEIVALGESITLECDALALPPANYFWFLVNCDTREVIESISTGDGLRVAGGNLTVEPAMRSHRGCYKCVANNSLEGSSSMIQHVTTLKVSGKQGFLSCIASI